MSTPNQPEPAQWEQDAAKEIAARFGMEAEWPNIAHVLHHHHATHADAAVIVLHNIVDCYEARSELYTSDAECAAALANKAATFCNLGGDETMRDNDRKNLVASLKLSPRPTSDPSAGAQPDAMAKELTDLRAEVTRLTAELAEARKDGERLDFIEATGSGPTKGKDGHFIQCVQVGDKPTHVLVHSGPTARAAIDAAKDA